MARESSRVVAWESSRVVAWGSSRVEARESSRVVARGSSSVEAWGSSRVEARDLSSVVAWGSSSVVAWGSSRVVACDSSSVEAWDSSSVEAWDFVTIQMFSTLALISLFNFATVFVRGINPENKIRQNDKTTNIINCPSFIERTFEEWLDQGYVHADGITKKFLSKKKVGKVEIFEVEEFLERKSSFVARKGGTFSHGETVEKAIEGLRYKLTDRDTSKFKNWKLTDKKSVDDLILAYRSITGACEYGVKQFCQSIDLKEKYSIKDVIKLVSGKYGSEKFEEFFK